MKEKPKGGVRQGAGRKPSADPKQPVTIFVETSKINYYGGKEGVQLFCYNALDADREIAFAPPKDVYNGPLLDNSKLKDELVFKSKAHPMKTKERPAVKLQPLIRPEILNTTSDIPKTLDELKALCPAELTGLDRSEWIRTERQKYGI